MKKLKHCWINTLIPIFAFIFINKTSDYRISVNHPPNSASSWRTSIPLRIKLFGRSGMLNAIWTIFLIAFVSSKLLKRLTRLRFLHFLQTACNRRKLLFHYLTTRRDFLSIEWLNCNKNARIFFFRCSIACQF